MGVLDGIARRDRTRPHNRHNADVGRVEVAWIDEDDPHVNPMGVKGIGEIGIVGTVAAVPTPSIMRPVSACATCRSR